MKFSIICQNLNILLNFPNNSKIFTKWFPQFSNGEIGINLVIFLVNENSFQDLKDNQLKEIYIKNIKQEGINIQNTDNSNNINDNNNVNNSYDNKNRESNSLLTKRQFNKYNELYNKNNNYEQIEKINLGKIKKFLIVYNMKKSDLVPDIQWPEK